MSDENTTDAGDIGSSYQTGAVDPFLKHSVVVFSAFVANNNGTYSFIQGTYGVGSLVGLTDTMVGAFTYNNSGVSSNSNALANARTGKSWSFKSAGKEWIGYTRDTNYTVLCNVDPLINGDTSASALVAAANTFISSASLCVDAMSPKEFNIRWSIGTNVSWPDDFTPPKTYSYSSGAISVSSLYTVGGTVNAPSRNGLNLIGWRARGLRDGRTEESVLLSNEETLNALIPAYSVGDVTLEAVWSS